LLKRLLSGALLLTLVVACSKTGTQGAPGAGVEPGHLRIAIQSDVKNLNPLLNSNTTDVLVDALMFEPLIVPDSKGAMQPMLATTVPTLHNGGITNHGLTITYHLRTDAKWTDGKPVTAADVIFSWKAIMNPNNDVISRHGYTDIASIDAPTPYTVVVHLKKPFAPFVNTFFTDSDQPYFIAPAHVLARYPNINTIPFNSEPLVSDGPFRFADWVHGDHITLLRNDNFFLGKPKLKTITLRIIPDENTTINLLRTHDIDWMFEASISNYPLVKSIPGIDIRWMSANGFSGIYVNTQRPFLKSLRVRQAVAAAIDKQRIIDTLTFGQEKKAIADVPPFMWSYDPKVKAIGYDPAKARTLLDAAGWKAGPGGIRVKNGQQLELVLVTDNSNATRVKKSEIIQEMLRKVGIKVQVKYFAGDVLFAPAGVGGILQGGKFDLALAGWFAGIDPDDSTQTTCANVAPAGYNYSRYCNPEMERLQKLALTSYDRATRKKAYAKIQQLLATDVPMIYLYYERQMEPISASFKGFAPNHVVESWNAWQWSI